MDEKVIVDFFGLLAKRTNATIFPSPLSQSIRRPKPILQRKPCMVFNFRRRPNFPNKFVQRRLNDAEKLQIVCGCRGVLPIARELPRDVILVLTQMHILDEGPKEHKLSKVLQGNCSLRG
jgi:hypothetical protein